MRVFLFDIDGTLVDAGGAGRCAMTAAFAEVFGVTQPFTAFDLLGRTDGVIVREVLRRHDLPAPDDATLDRFFARYLGHLEARLREGDGYRVLPGTEAIVTDLAARDDVLLGLGTGNVEPGARLKLARTGYAHLFRFGGFGLDGPDRPAVLARGVAAARRLAPDATFGPRDVWIVGDSVRDVEAAHAIGATAVAVATGWQDQATLAEAGPHHLFADMWGLHGLLAGG